MKTIKKFKEISSYQSENFKKYFGDMEYPNEDPRGLFSKKLERNMLDKEILGELKPTEVSLVDVYNHLKTASHDEWMIFYCRDKDNVLWAVRAYWYGDGWYLYAYSIEDPNPWNAGSQVCSRNSFDTLSLETLPKELVINGITYVKK